MKKFLTEDWVVTFLSIPLLIIAGLASFLPNNGFKISADLYETIISQKSLYFTHYVRNCIG